MNKENAHLFLPLVQAVADGKSIQCNIGTDELPDWNGAEWPDFNESPRRYRIKPREIQVKVWVTLLESGELNGFTTTDMSSVKHQPWLQTVATLHLPG